jgi:hypothetical protein
MGTRGTAGEGSIGARLSSKCLSQPVYVLFPRPEGEGEGPQTLCTCIRLLGFSEHACALSASTPWKFFALKGL